MQLRNQKKIKLRDPIEQKTAENEYFLTTDIMKFENTVNNATKNQENRKPGHPIEQRRGKLLLSLPVIKEIQENSQWSN